MTLPVSRHLERSTNLFPLICLGGVALLWTLLFIRILWNDPHSFDFGSFYRSGVAWNAGASAYQDARPNLNPPWLTAFVFGPLARLPIRVALALWLLLNALAVGRSLMLIARELLLTQRQILWMFVSLSISYSWILGWWQGQIGFVLMYVVTRGWLAARHGHPVAAGSWLALAIAVKPSLALAALPLGIETLSAAAVVSVAISLGSVIITGIDPWFEWLRSGSAITWYSHSPNASIVGVLARMNGLGGRDFVPLTAAVPASLWILWAGAAVLLVMTSMKCRRTDQRWASGLLMAIAVFPLAWSYYLPVALGPLVATVRGFSYLVTAGVIALALQMALLPAAGNEGLDFIIVASLGCVATLLLWTAVITSTSASAASDARQKRDVPG
jgi:hypothetical protein